MFTQMSPEELDELWPALPLSDAQIAARLGATRQQVISLRHVARVRLKRRLGMMKLVADAFAHWPMRAVAGVLILALLISAAAVLWRCDASLQCGLMITARDGSEAARTNEDRSRC